MLKQLNFRFYFQWQWSHWSGPINNIAMTSWCQCQRWDYSTVLVYMSGKCSLEEKSVRIIRTRWYRAP
jgi:hypothetical protein